MAAQNWTELAVYVGGYNVACRAKGFDAPQPTISELDVTALCDTWEKRIGGIKSASWSAEVMQDFAANEVDQLVGLSQLATSVPLSLAPAGTTEGDVAYTFEATQFQYSPLDAQAGELAMANIAGMGTGTPVVRGTLMNAPATPVTSTGTTTGVQVGAVTSGQRMYAALHVLSASGTSPTLDMVVQSDDNSGFSSATSRITFTQATGIGSEWSSVAGAVTDDYWRLSYTVGGTTPSFTFAVVIGIATP